LGLPEGGVDLFAKLVLQGVTSVLLGFFGDVGVVDGGLEASLSVRSVFHSSQIIYSMLFISCWDGKLQSLLDGNEECLPLYLRVYVSFQTSLET